MRRKSEFGPNQERVDDLLERLETVDQGQALFLASLAGDDSSRRQARSAVLAAARGSGRQKELDAAQREVTRWVNTWFSGGFQLSGYGRDVTPGEAAVGAAPVILDAVGALVMADRISPEDFETLIGPWRELDTTADPAGADFERLVSLMRELTAMLEQQGERRWAEWVRRDLAQVVDHDAHGLEHFLSANRGLSDVVRSGPDADRAARVYTEAYQLATSLWREHQRG
jgi:hypothetical protein